MRARQYSKNILKAKQRSLNFTEYKNQYSKIYWSSFIWFQAPALSLAFSLNYLLAAAYSKQNAQMRKMTVFGVYMLMNYILPSENARQNFFWKAYPPNRRVIQERLRIINSISYTSPRAALYQLQFISRKLWPNERYQNILARKYKLRTHQMTNGYMQSAYNFLYQNLQFKKFRLFLSNRIKPHLSILDKTAAANELFDQQFKFLQEFKQINQSLIMRQKQFYVNAKEKKGKFKISAGIGGEIRLTCIDSFQQIFGASKETLQSAEIIDLLDINTFNSHKEIIDGMLDFLYQLMYEYLKIGESQQQQKREMKLKQVHGDVVNESLVIQNIPGNILISQEKQNQVQKKQSARELAMEQLLSKNASLGEFLNNFDENTVVNQEKQKMIKELKYKAKIMEAEKERDERKKKLGFPKF